jgi:hypothetical protein
MPRRMPLPVWLIAIFAFLTVHVFMWSVVHVHADSRPCLTQLPDPLYTIVPFDPRWYFVSHQIYSTLTVLALVGLVYSALRGDERSLLRWGMALTLQAAIRSVTVTLLPICRMGVEAGTIPLRHVPTVGFGTFRIPWHAWAVNDLVFSGHVGEFLLLFWATRDWPRPVRSGLVVFQLAQAYALIATRGHYTIDMFLAVPCAYFADSVAVKILGALAARFRRVPVAVTKDVSLALEGVPPA